MKKTYKATLNNIFLDNREFLFIIVHDDGGLPVKIFLDHIPDDVSFHMHPDKLKPPYNNVEVVNDEEGWHLVIYDKQKYKITHEGIDRYMKYFKKFKYVRKFLNVLIKSLK